MRSLRDLDVLARVPREAHERAEQLHVPPQLLAVAELDGRAGLQVSAVDPAAGDPAAAEGEARGGLAGLQDEQSLHVRDDRRRGRLRVRAARLPAVRPDARKSMPWSRQ